MPAGAGPAEAWLRPKGTTAAASARGACSHPGIRTGVSQPGRRGGSKSNLRVRSAWPGRARGWAGRVPMERPCQRARPALTRVGSRRGRGPAACGSPLAHRGRGGGEPPRGPAPALSTEVGAARATAPPRAPSGPGGGCRFRRAAPLRAAPGGSPGERGWRCCRVRWCRCGGAARGDPRREAGRPAPEASLVTKIRKVLPRSCLQPPP